MVGTITGRDDGRRICGVTVNGNDAEWQWTYAELRRTKENRENAA